LFFHHNIKDTKEKSKGKSNNTLLITTQFIFSATMINN